MAVEVGVEEEEEEERGGMPLARAWSQSLKTKRHSFIHQYR
jgi:hypothetical protein